MKPKSTRSLNYDQVVAKCTEFLHDFEDYEMEFADPQFGRKKYMAMLQKIADGHQRVLKILIEDLEGFFRKEEELELLRGIKGNTIKYVRIFDMVSAHLLPKCNPETRHEMDGQAELDRKLREQRAQNLEAVALAGFSNSSKERLPTSMYKDYQVYIVYGSNAKHPIYCVGQLSSAHIGSLVTLRAMVTKTTEVKPELKVGVFACQMCGCENYQMVDDLTFTPMKTCHSNSCVQNKVSGSLIFLAAHSAYLPMQPISVQQTVDQLRQGSVPKTLQIYLKGTLIKQATPGDILIVQGVLLPSRRGMKKGVPSLSFDMYLEAMNVEKEKKRYVDYSISTIEEQEITALRSNFTETELFGKLAASIAPQIFGLEGVKKALLLMMVGGVSLHTSDEMRIRGEINVALIGDPGIAKSQLLKQVSRLSPRGVYTTGRGSSNVGLTAAVVVDQDTREVSLEAGALVLADTGICCIDQFDKMNEFDRTAIHEVMEQQIVSIAKAGITTTLNARTAILAAANPLFGRYNKKETPHKNINLPAALLSRFDLIFIMLDQVNRQADQDLSQHILRVHQSGKSPIDPSLSSDFLRRYISMTRNFKPVMNHSLHQQLADRYVAKRKEQLDLSRQGQSYTTMRSLLALIRLSQARAKLRFSNQVTQNDVDDCLELLELSQKSVMAQQHIKPPRYDNMSSIYEIIKGMCLYSEQRRAQLNMIEKRIFSRGFTLNELEKTMKAYANINVLLIEGDEVILLEGD